MPKHGFVWKLLEQDGDGWVEGPDIPLTPVSYSFWKNNRIQAWVGGREPPPVRAYVFGAHGEHSCPAYPKKHVVYETAHDNTKHAQSWAETMVRLEKLNAK